MTPLARLTHLASQGDPDAHVALQRHRARRGALPPVPLEMATDHAPRCSGDGWGLGEDGGGRGDGEGGSPGLRPLDLGSSDGCGDGYGDGYYGDGRGDGYGDQLGDGPNGRDGDGGDSP